ncbi:MAG TPA: hypothetical protein VGG32_02495 [Thermoplasmata archaeon]|jgi:hypothetical protein
MNDPSFPYPVPDVPDRPWPLPIQDEDDEDPEDDPPYDPEPYRP